MNALGHSHPKSAPDAPLPRVEDIDEHYRPTTPRELALAVTSWRWRIFSGQLYKIIVKSEDPDDPGTVMPFIPNAAQRQFLARLGHRNVILKARQLGFTTLIIIIWLDHALFIKNQRVAVIAHTKDAAESIFRDKAVFAYENLPDWLRKRMPIKTKNKSEILFAHNNSSVRVSISARSGTYQRLHVSEMGKIAAKFPDKATEIVTGSLPAVPMDGIAIVESTAEGQDGEFYKMATRAQANHEIGRRTARTFLFHFFPWFTDRGYVVDPKHVLISDEDHAYFDEIEQKMDTLLSMPQRAFYVSKRDDDFGGDHAKMWREYPSTPDECWQQSTEGRYWAKQLAMTRLGNRIRVLEVDPYEPFYTFWDIGSRDGTGVWVMQKCGEERRFHRFLQNWGSGYATMVQSMNQTGFTWAVHYLPHDAGHKRQQAEAIISPLDILQQLQPSWRFEVVPRVSTLEVGIETTRKHFPKAVFCPVGCKEGLLHLGNYQQRWNRQAGAWSQEPLKNNATEGADSFRQWAQMEESGLFQRTQTKRTRKPIQGAM